MLADCILQADAGSLGHTETEKSDEARTAHRLHQTTSKAMIEQVYAKKANAQLNE